MLNTKYVSIINIGHNKNIFTMLAIIVLTIEYNDFPHVRRNVRKMDIIDRLSICSKISLLIVE